MGNNASGIKKFLQNKNTVTVVGVVAAVLVLFIGYNIRVKSAINPITVPYAKQTINAGTQITESMVGTMQVPPAMLKGNVLRYPKGYVLYNMSVNTTTTYGNSIYPENYIDIYLKAVNKVDNNSQITEDADKIMLGKLIENVKVLAVKDSSGQSVFTNLDEKRTPAMIVFAVPEEYYILLKKAEYLRSYDTTLIPVPTNESYEDTQGELAVSSEKLKDWINRVTVWDETN